MLSPIAKEDVAAGEGALQTLITLLFSKIKVRVVMFLKVNMQVILFLERKPRTLRLREVGKSLLRSRACQHGAGGGAG